MFIQDYLPEFSFSSFIFLGLFSFIAHKIIFDLFSIHQNFESIEHNLIEINNRLFALEKKIDDEFCDTKEEISHLKYELLDSQNKIIKKYKKSAKSIKSEIEEVKNNTVIADDGFNDLITNSLQLLTKALKGDSLDEIIESVHQNVPGIDFTKITQIFGNDIESLAKVYKLIHLVESELAEYSDKFVSEFSRRLKYKSEDDIVDDETHADYCPFCLIYDILTELDIRDGIKNTILSYVKDYYLLLREKQFDHWNLGDNEPNFRIFFLYHRNMDSVIEECKIFQQIDNLERRDMGQQVLNAFAKFGLTQ